MMKTQLVIPLKNGIQFLIVCEALFFFFWTPTFVGVTVFAHDL